MSDLQIEKTQQEPTLMQNSPISHKQQQQQQSIFIPLSSSIMVDLDHHTHNKRRSPPSSSSAERSSKKHSFNQEDLSLTGNGFSANALPIGVCGNFLSHCVSDPYTLHEQSPTGLPPLPSENLRRCKSDVVVPSKVKTVTPCLNSEENVPDDSIRLKRMKERLTEMKQWWDEVIKEEVDDEKEQEQEEHSLVAEDDNILSQDELGKDDEEAISVEWIEKSLNLTFRCPCGKGYEVQICGNNCYYKLV